MTEEADLRRVRVWDRIVRAFHWGLVLTFGLAWFNTGHIGWLHKGAGYAALALVLVRIVWGFVAPSPHARFSGFVPGPRQLLTYLGDLLRNQEPRHLGHNPAGAVMILFLLAAVIGIGVSGWMLTTDAFWGSEGVEVAHVVLVDVALVAVVLHVVANVVASLRQRENLILSMITGYKRRDIPAEGDASDAEHAAAGAPAPGGPLESLPVSPRRYPA